MATRSLDAAQRAAARATLAGLRDAPEVRDILSAPFPFDAPVRKAWETAAASAALAVACGGALWFLLSRGDVPEDVPTLLAVIGGVAGVHAVRRGWKAGRMARVSGAVDLVVVLSRTRERSKDEEAPDQFRAAVETVDGRRIVLSELKQAEVDRLVPGQAGVLWTRDGTYLSFRSLGPAVDVPFRLRSPLRF